VQSIDDKTLDKKIDRGIRSSHGHPSSRVSEAVQLHRRRATTRDDKTTTAAHTPHAQRNQGRPSLVTSNLWDRQAGGASSTQNTRSLMGPTDEAAASPYDDIAEVASVRSSRRSKPPNVDGHHRRHRHQRHRPNMTSEIHLIGRTPTKRQTET